MQRRPRDSVTASLRRRRSHPSLSQACRARLDAAILQLCARSGLSRSQVQLQPALSPCRCASSAAPFAGRPVCSFKPARPYARKHEDLPHHHLFPPEPTIFARGGRRSDRPPRQITHQRVDVPSPDAERGNGAHRHLFLSPSSAPFYTPPTRIPAHLLRHPHPALPYPLQEGSLVVWVFFF